MVRKGCAFLLLVLLLLPAAGFAAGRVTDECGLFTQEEIAAIEAEIDEIRQTYQMDVAVLTTTKVPDNRSSSSEDQTMAYADRYYEEQGYGMGEDRAGLLYLIDMHNRVSYVSTAGIMIDYIDEDREEELLGAADDDLAARRYGRATLSLLRKLKSILSRGIREGHFRFDDVTGERLTGLYNKLTTGELAVAALVGAGAGLLALGAVLGRYKRMAGTYRFDKATQSAVSLTRNEKTFLRSRVSRTRISSGGSGGRFGGGSGSGSGVHISSGGMSHGGGGHHF